MPKKNHKKIKGGNEWGDNPFIAPDGYFESFNDKVLMKIKQEKNLQIPVYRKKTLQILRSQLIFAASFIGLALIIYSGIQFILGKQSFNNSQNNYITEVIEIEMGNISEDMLYEMIEPQSLTDVSDDNIDEIIIEYLINTKIDFETLFNEL